MKAATERFSDRVANYAKYRPGYPAELVVLLRETGVLSPASVVADIGSGTGLLTRLFLEHGHQVFAVEPNDDMRAAGEQALCERPNFQSVAGRAEHTTLASGSVDMVTAGQAFHWFDRAKARREFARILRPPAWVVLVWNERETGSPFLEGYESLLRTHASEYLALGGCHMDPKHIETFFAPASFEKCSFANSQSMDRAGLRGRLLSSSYAPLAHEPGHAPMMRELDELFRRHAERGTVELMYQTRVYFGRLA